MKNIVTIILMAVSTVAAAQTQVSGNQSGTWPASGSPYQVTGEITVPGGQTLTIEPGVEVSFQGHYKFIVRGTLDAEGTETDSIFFTTADQTTGWGGIRFDGSDGISHLSYCRIEFGKTGSDYPDNHGGAVALLTADAEFSHCVFADNDATGDNDGMGGAVYAINTGNSSGPLTRFTDCTFLRNHAYGEGGAIKFTSDMNTEIWKCEFIDNTCFYGGGAISFYSATDTKMVFCLFAGNSTTYSSGGAIHTLGFGNTLIFQQCTFSGNSAPGGDGGAVNLAYATATFVNSIVYENPGMYSDDIYLDFDGYADINYCDVNMPDGATGGNNIYENPEFRDAVNGDYHLLENSPCIDAGTDIGYDFLGTAPDMGCFEFDPMTGINDSETTHLKVFPNPAGDEIYFSLPGKDVKEIIILDLQGKPVFTGKSTHGVALDVSGLKAGVYFISVRTKNETLTTKIIKR